MVQCACRVEHNGIALPCEIDACEIDVLPHEIDASTEHHPLCVRGSRPSQLVFMRHDFHSLSLFMRHDILNLSRIFFKLRETWHLLDNIDHCTRLVVVINPRHCVRHDNFIVLSDFSKFPTLPGNTSQSSARFLVDLSLCLQKFTAIYQDALQNCLGNLSRCSCAQCLD